MLRFIALLLLSLSTTAVANCDAHWLLHLSPNQQGLPGDWQPQLFDKIPQHTDYQVVQENDESVLRAASRASASGLIKPLNIDLKQYPILSWRWKISERPTGKDDGLRDDDDHAARLYLMFNTPQQRESKLKLMWRLLSSDEAELPHAINYIWAHSAPLDIPLANPYDKRVMMIPVNRGDTQMHQWVELERDLLADYRASFQRDPPQLTGIAIMSDTDNTASGAIALYADIKLSRKQQDNQATDARCGE